MNAFHALRLAIALAIIIALTPTASAGDAADKKLVEGIAQEIDLVPGLYVRLQTDKPKELPTFSAKRLALYADKDQNLDKERGRWKANKDKYAKDFPLRAAIFEAADTAPNPTLTMVLQGPLNAKTKAAAMDRQAAIAVAIFKLEQSLAAIKDADEHRAKETSKRWQANFDFARLRVEGNIAFLTEYNFMLGKIRNDQLPDVGPGGWKVVLEPKLSVTEAKAKDLFKQRGKLIKKVQEDYVSTPWDYFAERESKYQLGLKWTSNAK